MKSCSTVTVGIIAYNEHDYLPLLLEDIRNQTYPKKNMEIILVDGNSSDDTLVIMNRFKTEHESDFSVVTVLTNMKRTQPSGWNVVINHSRMEVLIKIDAHARIPENFVEKSMACINSGEFVCGGPRENIIDGENAWKHMILDAEQSIFGSGMAIYRRKTQEKKPVKSVFHGAYRREVFEKVGLFDERLIRTEDNELHYRMRKAGYTICYDPEILSFFHTRNSLKKMIKQKYSNGYWIGKTLFVCPGCISLFHLMPLFFVMALLVCGVLTAWGVYIPLLVLMGVYCLANLFTSLTTFIQSKKKSIVYLVLPLVFFLLHTGYGMGTVIGIVEMIFRKIGKLFTGKDEL